jgi:predicted Zn finger-like uncharacterized protein
MADKRIISPLALSPDGQFHCPHCAAVYDVDHLHSLGRDEGAETCEDCGATMAVWSSSVVPVFKRAPK